MNHLTFLSRQTVVFSLVAIVFACAADNSEGQLLRRFRDNVRRSLAPQRNSARANFAPRDQLRSAIPQTNVPNGLTPYARLSPTQRGDNSVFGAQPGDRIKVVTYLDPRTGRTFERRYLISENVAADRADANQPSDDGSELEEEVSDGRPNTDVDTRGAVSSTLESSVADAASQPQRSLVPPISFVPYPPQSPVVAVEPEEILPVLSGPVLSAATGPVLPVANANSVASAETFGASINASIDDDSRVEMASSETVVSPISDLSGIVVSPGPVDSQAVEAFFAEDEADTALSGGLKDDPIYSILETEEE